MTPTDTHRIDIPRTGRSATTGEVMEQLFAILVQSEQREARVEWHFKSVTSMHPILASMLSIYRDTIEGDKPVIMTDQDSRKFLSDIAFAAPMTLSSKEDACRVMSAYAQNTYLPVCKFQADTEQSDTIQSAVCEAMCEKIPSNHKLKYPLTYIVSELATNIAEHSGSKFAYIHAQAVKQEDAMYICIADAGITIHSSYLKTGKCADEIGDDPAMALKKAIAGFSTKDRPYAESRGFGLSTSTEMAVRGMRGAVYILSGAAFYKYDTKGCDFVRMPETFEWQGTDVIIKIPLQTPDSFNYIDYIE